jgi:hypothetical protein
MDKIKYISPSSFYYWEKCPLKGLYSKQPEYKLDVPNNPNMDLGTLIHKFHEKCKEWGIQSQSDFSKKWDDEIKSINERYQNKDLQRLFFPIQWHSKYYAVKKKLLCQSLIKKISIENSDSRNNYCYLFEEWVNNNDIGGYVDLIIKEGDKVTQIIDFKTGNIYEKKGNSLQVKEVYKQQLALYCAIIMERQDTLPNLYLELIDGKKIAVDVDLEYISSVSARAKKLKEKINSAIDMKSIDSLAVCDIENCKFCNYKLYCVQYQNINTDEK